MGCLDETTIDDLVAGRLEGLALGAADAHLDACASCSAVVAAMLESSSGAEPIPATTFAVGARIGRYEVGELLGEGAMGAVYAAFDPELGRRVALKFLHPLVSDAASSERLQKEGQAMARLGHPNVVAVYDVGTFEGRVYLAMELVAGQTLRKWMTESRSWREVVAILIQAGEGLRAAHDAGLVHRDFKPDNVLVGNDGRVKVTDLGLARQDGGGTSGPAPSSITPSKKASTFAGTPAYMSPEQLGRMEATPASDQFAFATTAWEALTGARPFSARSLAELESAIARGAPPSSLPAFLHRALARALARNPSARFASMAALLEVLRRGSRRSTGTALALGGALLLGAGAAVGWMVAHPGDRCGMPERAFDAWTDARETRIATAFDAVAPVKNDRAFAWTRGAMRAYRASWLEASSESCRQNATPAAKARVVACLDSQKRHADRAAASLEEATSTTIATVDELVASLDAPAECLANTAAMEGPSPADAHFDDELANLGAAMADPSRDEETLRGLEKLIERARSEASRPLLGRALLARARSHRNRGDAKSASADAEEALLVFDAAKDDVDVPRAWLSRVAIEGERGAWATADGYAKLAEASLHRVNDPPQQAAALDHLRGVIAMNLGDFATAEKRLVAARDQRIALFGKADPRVGETLTALGILASTRGDLDRALELHQEARAIDAAAFGETSPALARHEHNLGGVFRKKGDLDSAVQHYDLALDLELVAFGERHLSVARTRNSLGLVALQRRHFVEAIEQFKAARDTLKSLDHAELAIALQNLGLCELGRLNTETAGLFFYQALGVITSHGLEGSLLEAQIQASLGQALTLMGDAAGGRKALERVRGIAHASGGTEAQGILDQAEQALPPSEGSASAGPPSAPTAPAHPPPLGPKSPVGAHPPSSATPPQGVYAPAQTLGH